MLSQEIDVLQLQGAQICRGPALNHGSIDSGHRTADAVLRAVDSDAPAEVEHVRVLVEVVVIVGKVLSGRFRTLVALAVAVREVHGRVWRLAVAALQMDRME